MLNKLVVANTLVLLPLHALRVVVFVNRPHRIGIKTGSDVVVFASFGRFAGVLRRAPLLFAPRRSAGELAGDIDEFLNARADFLKIILHARPAVAEYFTRSSLIPIDAAALNHLIEEPALLAPAAHFAFGFDSHKPSETASTF